MIISHLNLFRNGIVARILPVKDEKVIRFDVIVSFNAKNRRTVFSEAIANVQKAFPNYRLQASLNMDFSEE